MRIPNPPKEYDRRWASELVRVLTSALDDASRPSGIGYRTYQASPLRVFDARDGTSAVAAVGTVAVVINGAQGVIIPVAGVGGAYSAPDSATTARVLSTLIADGKARGSIG